MKKLHLLSIGVALMLPALSQAANSVGIIGSPHDFSTNSWALQHSSHLVCEVCHSIHHTDTNSPQTAPLWAHATTATTFIPYSSSLLKATVGQPSGVSLACLSCHDGTVGINQPSSGAAYGGTAIPIAASFIIPDNVNDMHATHPVSFTYDAALATAAGDLENPTTYHIGDNKSLLTYNSPPVPAAWPVPATSMAGQTIDQAMLRNHKVECASCHDVHKMRGMAPASGILTVLTGDDANGKGSLLCRTCHIK
jgi:hypothetical protein